jgi:hypothetical protein
MKFNHDNRHQGGPRTRARRLLPMGRGSNLWSFWGCGPASGSRTKNTWRGGPLKKPDEIKQIKRHGAVRRPPWGGRSKVCKFASSRTGAPLSQRFFSGPTNFQRAFRGSLINCIAIVGERRRQAQANTQLLDSLPLRAAGPHLCRLRNSTIFYPVVAGAGGGRISAVFRARTGGAGTRIFAPVSENFFSRPRLRRCSASRPGSMPIRCAVAPAPHRPLRKIAAKFGVGGGWAHACRGVELR